MWYYLVEDLKNRMYCSNEGTLAGTAWSLSEWGHSGLDPARKWTHFEHDCSGWVVWMETGTKCQRTFIYLLLESQMIRNWYKRQLLSLKMEKENWCVSREKRRCRIHQITAQRKGGLGKDALSDTRGLSLPSIRLYGLQLIWAEAMPVNRKHLWYVSRWFTLIFWSGICQTTHPWPERSAAVLQTYSHCIQAACWRSWSVNETPALTLLTFDRFCVHADVFYFEIQTSCDGKRSSADICWDVPAPPSGHRLFVLSAEIE